MLKILTVLFGISGLGLIWYGYDITNWWTIGTGVVLCMSGISLTNVICKVIESEEIIQKYNLDLIPDEAFTSLTDRASIGIRHGLHNFFNGVVSLGGIGLIGYGLYISDWWITGLGVATFVFSICSSASDAADLELWKLKAVAYRHIKT